MWSSAPSIDCFTLTRQPYTAATLAALARLMLVLTVCCAEKGREWRQGGLLCGCSSLADGGVALSPVGLLPDLAVVFAGVEVGGVLRKLAPVRFQVQLQGCWNQVKKVV